MVAKKVQFPSHPACCNMHVWLSDSIFFCSNFYQLSQLNDGQDLFQESILRMICD